VKAIRVTARDLSKVTGIWEVTATPAEGCRSNVTCEVEGTGGGVEVGDGVGERRRGERDGKGRVPVFG
jgi:hypothetical protein